MYVLELENVDLMYRSAESLSYKRLLSRGEDNIIKKYKALNDITFSIEKGKVYGVIGGNGAGKSTLLRVLSGVMSPNSGTIRRNYKTINLLALGIGFTRQLSGLDNIFLSGMLLGFSKKEIADMVDDIVEYSELEDFINRPMKTYSSGMVSRLGFSIAIHLRPEVLLIDEVLSVGDAKFKKKSFESIQSIIKDEETTVVMVSHGTGELESICDRVIWLDKGRIVTKGEAFEILALYTKYNQGKITLGEILAKRLVDISDKKDESHQSSDVKDNVPRMEKVSLSLLNKRGNKNELEVAIEQKSILFGDECVSFLSQDERRTAWQSTSLSDEAKNELFSMDWLASFLDAYEDTKTLNYWEFCEEVLTGYFMYLIRGGMTFFEERQLLSQYTERSYAKRVILIARMLQLSPEEWSFASNAIRIIRQHGLYLLERDVEKEDKIYTALALLHIAVLLADGEFKSFANKCRREGEKRLSEAMDDVKAETFSPHLLVEVYNFSRFYENQDIKS